MTSAHSKTSSSTSHDHNSNSSPPTGGEQQIQSSTQKMISKTPQSFPQAKRRRHENNENPKATTSLKKSKTSSGVAVDLEELLAQTYPKEPSYTPAARKEVRRSSRSKHRPVKSVESAKKWSAKDEICVARALLETCSASGEVNMNAFYQRAKQELQKEISNTQLYDKARTMNRRFRSIRSKLEEQNITEDEFPFRTPQEPELFQLWMKIWGKDDNISANGGQIARDGNLSEAENPREIKFENKTEELDDKRAAAEESTGDQRQREEEEPQQRNLQKKSSPPQTLAENGKKTTCCEGECLQNRMKNLLESTEQRVEALIRGSYNSFQSSFGGGCTCSILSRRMKDLMDGVTSVEEFPGLSGGEANELQQKWRRHRIQEVKMVTECLGLLHGQCEAFLQSLDS